MQCPLTSLGINYPNNSIVYSFMFNNFYQSVFPHCGGYINSTACDCVFVDGMSGTATVHFTDGNVYHYTNVSRRAIIKFIIDDARSLGKFVNNVLMQSRVKCTAASI